MQNPFIRFTLLTTLSFTVVTFARVAYYACSDGFSLTRIENRINPNSYPITEKNPNSSEIKTLQKLCSTPFLYLKKGSQSYAFQSKEAPYILKLYKCHHLQPADWLNSLPFPSFLIEWKKNLIARRKYKLELSLSSFSIAQTILKNECGIFYAQVFPNNAYDLKSTIIDRVGRSYQINLADYGYAIQRKAELVYVSLHNWIESGDIKSGKEALTSLIGLLVSRSKKGIQDSDPDLHKNAGFIGTTAIFIDIGSFHKNQKISDPHEMKRDIQKITANLLKWLETRNKELYMYATALVEDPLKIDWKPVYQ